MSRTSDDIKRLAGIRVLQAQLEAEIALLNDKVDKAQILGQRGIGYMDATTGALSGASGTTNSGITAPLDAVGAGIAGAVKSGTTAALNAVVGDAAATAAGEAGSTSGNLAFEDGTNIIKGTDGVYDANSIIAGSAVGMNGNIVKGITGLTDPATGRALAIYTDGFFRPPSDRADADSDAIDTTFTAGYNWTNGAPAPEGSTDYTTPQTAAIGYVAYYNSAAIQAITGQRIVQNSLVYVNLTTWSLTITTYNLSTGALVGTSTQSILGGACTVGVGVCAATAPSLYSWLESGLTQLAQNNLGQFVANVRDVNVPLSFQGAKSTIVGKLNSTPTYAAVRQTKSGGFLFGVSSAAGSYLDTTSVFSPVGQLVTAVPAAVANILALAL